MNIEITIPVLNEEATLYNQIKKVDHFLDENLYDFKVDILIADNGSSDQTRYIAEQLAEEIPRVKYKRLEEKGVGRALKASWKNSEADIVGYMDLDLATDLKHLKPALNRLIQSDADIVTGTRLAKGSSVSGRKPVRKITSLGLNSLIKVFFRVKFTDGMCGFKFIKREHVNRIIECGAQSDGWFFATELLIVGEHLNLKVHDLPVNWRDDPSSKVKIITLAMEYLRAMVSLRKKLKTTQCYDKNV